MRAKILIGGVLFGLCLLLIVIVSCQRESVSNEDVLVENKSGVITCTDEYAIFSVSNESRKEMTVSLPYEVTVKKNEKWMKVDLLETAMWNSMTMIVESGQATEIKLPIKEWFGTLEEGEYQLIVTCMVKGEEVKGTCEFVVKGEEG